MLIITKTGDHLHCHRSPFSLNFIIDLTIMPSDSFHDDNEEWDSLNGAAGHGLTDTTDSQCADNPEEFPEEARDPWRVADDHQAWVSQEDYLAYISDPSIKTPHASSWKDLNKESNAFEVTVDKTKLDGFDQLKKELNVFFKNVKTLPLPRDLLVPPRDDKDAIFQFYFGPKSKMANYFTTELKLMTMTYLRFMMTYFETCQFNTSLPNLERSASHRTNHLLCNEEFNKIWKLIADESQKSTGGKKAVWMKLEEFFNECSIELFVSKDKDFFYIVGLDNDKVHFEYSEKTVMAGLQGARHVGYKYQAL